MFNSIYNGYTTLSTNKQQIFNSFGEALEHAIKINRLSHSDFAQKWGKDKGQVSKYINNVTTPRRRNINEVEELLNVLFKNKEAGWAVDLKEESKNEEKYKTGDISPEELSREGETLYSAISKLPQIGSSDLTRDDAEMLLGFAESLIRSVREGLKDSDPD